MFLFDSLSCFYCAQALHLNAPLKHWYAREKKLVFRARFEIYLPPFFNGLRSNMLNHIINPNWTT
jgi:hypothetical protein